MYNLGKFNISEQKKIFRPWDLEQDSTISTTTEEAKDVKEVNKKNDEMLKEEEILKEEAITPGYPQSYLYPDVLPGLSYQSDPFLESLHEEYTRVLLQEEQSKNLNRKQRPKKYKCEHCGVGFSNNGQLKGHVRIHTGERPFKCEEKDCGKTFTRNEELTRHKRIHSGVRPFSCSECGKSFGRKDHLKKHMKTHMQPRGLFAVPVMLPFSAWSSMTTTSYPYLPMYY